MFVGWNCQVPQTWVIKPTTACIGPKAITIRIVELTKRKNEQILVLDSVHLHTYSLIQFGSSSLHERKRECANNCTLTRSNISTVFSFRQFDDSDGDGLRPDARSYRFNYPYRGTWPSLPDNSEAGANFGKWSFLDHSFLVCWCWLTDLLARRH